MKINKILFNLILVLSLCSCNQELSGRWQTIFAPDFIKGITGFSDNGDRYYSSSSPFNTVMNLNYFLNDKNGEENNNKLVDDISRIYSDEISRLHKLFDRHLYYEDENNEIINNLKIINKSYGSNEEIVCSDELYQLLKEGVAAFELTDGVFNIFTGSISDYWSDIFSNAYNSTLDEIDPYFNENQRILLENYVSRIPNTIEDINAQLTFNDQNKSVKFNKINIDADDEDKYRPIISVGGIGKGYATDIVKTKLVENNYLDGMLFSGGSSISSLSTPIHSKDVKGQKISVVNPLTSNSFEKKLAFSIQISDEFNFSTSANNTSGKSYWFVDENVDKNKVNYRHHILNPKTGYPESYHRSVSILSYSFSNSMVDILSTTFMNLSTEDGLKFRQELLEMYPNSSLELFYIDQVGYGSNATVKVIATSTVNDTLQVDESVELIYA